MKNILIYLGHPAHFHLFKNIIKFLNDNNYQVFIVIKDKDILEYLITTENINYEKIWSKGKSGGKLGLAWSILRRDRKSTRLNSSHYS